jgi:protein-S-isoprenylcysteine O-methyltransferase Ste14
MKNSTARAWVALGVLALVMAPLIFVLAGTVHYWQAWMYLSIFFGASALLTRYVIRNDPALLERRMRGGPTAEKRAAQRVIMFFTSLCFVALLVVPALDRRYAWTEVPFYGVLIGDALVAVGFYFIFLVYKENTFASATVQVVAGQQVISTGPYAIVRHPMYASGLLMLLGTPLALGSYWGLVPVAAMAPFLIWRLFDEERLLRDQLAGYREYQQKVRDRLLPWIW